MDFSHHLIGFNGYWWDCLLLFLFRDRERDLPRLDSVFGCGLGLDLRDLLCGREFAVGAVEDVLMATDVFTLELCVVWGNGTVIDVLRSTSSSIALGLLLVFLLAMVSINVGSGTGNCEFGDFWESKL